MTATRETVTLTVPAASITSQLSALIADGATPEQATEAVIGPYQMAPIHDQVRGVILTAARAIAYQRQRRMERRTVFRRHSTLTAEQRQMISAVTFRDGNGNEIEWGRATVADHQARIAWNRLRADRLAQDTARHEAARKLIEAEGATCLDDIPDWQERIAEICEQWDETDLPTSGEDDDDASESARGDEPADQ